MKRGAWGLVFISALAGACRGDGSGTSDASTGTTSQTGGSTSVPTSGGDSASVTSSPAVTSTSEGTTAPSNTTFEPIDCGEALIELPIPTPSVMLVLDKSGSMVVEPGGFWDHDKDPNTPMITRWNSLVSAVEQVLGEFGNSMYLGAVLFPSTAATASYSEAACVVSAKAEVPLAPMNAAAVLGGIPGALDVAMIKGATPTTRGLELAIQALADGPSDHPRVMILITDGAANCQENAPDPSALLEVYDDKVEETVAAALAMGIATYVVGVDISQGQSGGEIDGNPDNVDTYEKLNALALAGGVARPGAEKFFSATDQGQLGAALTTISMALVPCVITLDPTPKYPLEVEVAPYGHDQVEDCMTQDGWTFLPKLDPADPEEKLRIELCGQACADYRMRGELGVQYRCPVE